MAVATEKRESGIIRFIRDAWSEMRKVVWPTQQETARLTGVVIAVASAVGIFLGAFDLLFTQLVQLLERI